MAQPSPTIPSLPWLSSCPSSQKIPVRAQGRVWKEGRDKAGVGTSLRSKPRGRTRVSHLPVPRHTPGWCQAEARGSTGVLFLQAASFRATHGACTGLFSEMPSRSASPGNFAFNCASNLPGLSPR